MPRAAHQALGNDASRDVKATVKSTMTAKYFAAQLAIIKESLPKSWGEGQGCAVENPFVSSSHICDGCGTSAAASGAALLRCTRCVEAWYCSK